MTGPIAAGATWGISGPTFIMWYVGLAMAVIAVVLWRRRLGRGKARRPQRKSLTAVEAGMLRSPELAVAAGLTSLLVTGSVGHNGHGALRLDGAPPPQASPLELALHQAVRENWSRDSLIRHPAVTAALTALEQQLVADGFLRSRRHLTVARRGALWLLPVLALGVVRAAAGLSNGRPIGFLVITMAAVTVVFMVLLLKPPRRPTERGDLVLPWMRKKTPHLRPGRSPALHSYGPAAAGVAVALYGAAVLRDASPGFAAAVSAPGFGAAAGGGSAGGYSGGAGCGGGGGGGGGGGCGG